MIIKRWNGSSFIEEYPKTKVDKIVASGTPGSTTFLRGDGAWAKPTPAGIGAAATSHVHGAITNAGAIGSDTAIASGFKLVATDGSGIIRRSSIAFGTNTTQYLRNDGSWSIPVIASGVASFKTGNYTLLLEDSNKFIVMNATSNASLTIPTNTSVPFPIGTEVHIVQYQPGVDISITPTTGVTLLSEGSKRKINTQYQVVTIKKLNTNLWILFGALKS